MESVTEENKELSTLALNTLLEVTNHRVFKPAEAKKHLERVKVHSPGTLRIIMNYVDCL
jgi:hypothetical protein